MLHLSDRISSADDPENLYSLMVEVVFFQVIYVRFISVFRYGAPLSFLTFQAFSNRISL